MSGKQVGRRAIQRSLRVGVDERGRVACAPQQAPHSLQPRRCSGLQLQPHLPHERRAACQGPRLPAAPTSPSTACDQARPMPLSGSHEPRIMCLRRLTVRTTAEHTAEQRRERV